MAVEPEQPQKLPFDIGTILKGLWQKRWFLLVGLVAVVFGAVYAGKKMGKQTYSAETSILFTAHAGTMAGGVYRIPRLTTYQHLILRLDVMEEVGKRLGLEIDPETIKGCVEVVTDKKTDIMKIKGWWDTPGGAADMANTVRDVFVDLTVRLRTDEAVKYATHYKERIDNARKALKAANGALEAFSSEFGVVDLDKEAQWYLDEYTAIEIKLEESRMKRRRVDLQLKGMDKAIQQLKNQIAQEQAEAADMEGLGASKTRSDRLRELIHQDKADRTNQIELARLETAYKRAQEMYRHGLIPREEMENAKAAYEAQHARTVDTKQVIEWKEELKKLDKVLVPKKAAPPSAPILREILLKQFELELEQASLTDQVTHYEEAVARVRKKLDSLPEKRKTFIPLQVEVDARKKEIASLEKLYTEVEQLAQKTSADFVVITPAVMPKFPAKSSKKMISIVIIFLGGALLFGAVLFRVVLDKTVRSVGEVDKRVDLPLLLEIPDRKRMSKRVDVDPEAVERELFRNLSRAVRKATPDRGARFLVTSPGAETGTSSIVWGLADALAGRDEKVLVIDAHLRGEHDFPDMGRVVESERAASLAQYLNGERDDALDAVLETEMPNVHYLPGAPGEVRPDMLASARMLELLDASKERYDVVLIDAPPAGTEADAAFLSEFCDSLLVVLRAHVTEAAKAKACVKALAFPKSRPLGVVLNDVHPLYAEGV